MKRAEHLRSATDFAAVRAHGRATHCAALTLSWGDSAHAFNRFGFVVGKRVGNAVTRNLVKRRLRAIIDARRHLLFTSFDIVFIARPSAPHRSFADLERDIDRLLTRAKLWHPMPAAKQQLPTATSAPPSE